MSVDISKLSNIYNNTNVKSISDALDKIKAHFGERIFEALLDDIVSENKVGVDHTLRDATIDKPYYHLSEEDELKNKMLRDFRYMLDFANRYNSPEAKCEDCGKVASDVFNRPGIGRNLCTVCYEKLVPHTKASVAVVKALKSYGYAPDNNEDMFIEPTDDIKDTHIDLGA